MVNNVIDVLHKKIVPSFLLIVVVSVFTGCGYKGDPVYKDPTIKNEKTACAKMVSKCFDGL